MFFDNSVLPDVWTACPNSKCLDNKSTLDNTISTNQEEKSLTLGPHNFYSIKNFPVFNFAALPDLISHFIFHR